MSKALIAMDKSGSFRVYITVTTDLAEKARQIHNTMPLGSAALGRVLTAAGLMGIMMKDKENKLTVNFKGDGPAGQILATAYGNGDVKGYISNPQVDLPLTAEGKLDVGGAFGEGSLTVIKDLGLKEPYMGNIALVSGEIAEDLTAYFFISEQQNSSVALGVKVERDHHIGAAGGMIIQMLPGAEEGAIDALEEMIAGMDPITSVIADAKATNSQGETAPDGTAPSDTAPGETAPGETAPDDAGSDSPAPDAAGSGAAVLSDTGLVRKVLRDIFDGMPPQYEVEELEERDITWNCDCSRERIEAALIAIGEEDLREIIEEDGQAELQCHFCLKKYQFNKTELEEILRKITG